MNNVPSLFRHLSEGNYHGSHSSMLTAQKWLTKKGTKKSHLWAGLYSRHSRQSQNMRQLCDPKLTYSDFSIYCGPHRLQQEIQFMSCWLLSPQKIEKISQFQHTNVTIHAMKATEADLCFVSEAVHIIYYLMHKAAQLFCKAFVCTTCR